MRNDTRYALRLLRRSPGFTLAAVLTLALGIGATTAIYSVVYGLLLRPLPVHNEASLVIAYVTDPGIRDNGSISYPRFLQWRSSGAFDDIAVLTTTPLDLADGAAERVNGAHVSGNFFAVLGVNAALGRVLTEADRGASETPVVISDALWRRRFSADPAALGARLSAGDLRLTIVGVMPPGFERWRGEAHLWIPLDAGVTRAQLASRGWHLFTAVDVCARHHRPRRRPRCSVRPTPRPIAASRLPAGSSARTTTSRRRWWWSSTKRWRGCTGRGRIPSANA